MDGGACALEDLKALAERAQAEADFVRAAAGELSDSRPNRVRKKSWRPNGR